MGPELMESVTNAAPRARLAALATATPPHDLWQPEVAGHAGRIFASVDGFARLAGVYAHAEVARRHSCVPIEWFLEEHGFPERNALFLEHATGLLAEAALRALDEAGLRAGDIDMLVTVSSSGIATPALDARLMRRLPFRADVQRIPVFGLGCVGGVLGLARAAALAEAAPASRVLLLAVELCSLTFRRQDHSKSNIVATALFGDGAAAAVVTCRDGVRGWDAAPVVGARGEHTWPDSLEVMGWDVAEDGLKVIFSRDIPALVRAGLRPVVDGFLARHRLALADIDQFICHPGGAKVLDALEECFGLRPGDLRFARRTLRDHGNMSSVTVLFVLRAALDAGARGRHLMTSLGPGFTAGMLVLDVP